jgi:hypothetical protein
MIWQDPIRKERMRRRVSRTLQFVWDHRTEKEKQHILRNLEPGRKNGHVAWNVGKKLGPYPEDHRQAISNGLKRYWELRKATPALKKPVQSVPRLVPDKPAVAVLKEMKRQLRQIERTMKDLQMVTTATKPIKMIPVSSSNIQSIGYDVEHSILAVQFASGRTYEYQNVTEEIYKMLIEADSVGSTFKDLIRSNPAKYPYREV